MLALEMAAFWLSGQWVSATFAATAVVAKTNYKSWTLACDDTDTLMTIAHGFKQTVPTGNPLTDVAPDDVVIVPNTSTRALAGAYAISVSSTTLTIQKQSAAGSGGVPAAKIVASRPHSIME